MSDKLAILCPITSRGCSERVEEQPLFTALLPSLDRLRLWDSSETFLAYDDDDPLWSRVVNRGRVDRPVYWLKLRGLRGNLTAIWEKLAWHSRHCAYRLPANDDLELYTSPVEAVDVVRGRRGFGTCAFIDPAFPDWPTFFVVGPVHFEIFGTLYPVPWTGAHQDPWIADVYRPWRASEIDPRFRVHNRMGISGPRFEYGTANGYRGVVLDGRRKVNAYLRAHPEIAEPVSEAALEGASFLL